MLSAAGHTVRVIEGLNKGDTSTVLLAATQGVGDLMSDVGGYMLMAGKSGAMPLLVAGTILSLGGAVVEKVFGNTPEEEFLNKLGYNR